MSTLVDYHSYRSKGGHYKLVGPALYSYLAGGVDRVNRAQSLLGMSLYTLSNRFIVRIFQWVLGFSIINSQLEYKRLLARQGDMKFDRPQFFDKLLDGLYWLCYNMNHFWVPYFPVATFTHWLPRRGEMEIPSGTRANVICVKCKKDHGHAKQCYICLTCSVRENKSLFYCHRHTQKHNSECLSIEIKHLSADIVKSHQYKKHLIITKKKT
jgi:hypothetical protein